jgi:hypothetical protein
MAKSIKIRKNGVQLSVEFMKIEKNGVQLFVEFMKIEKMILYL